MKKTQKNDKIKPSSDKDSLIKGTKEGNVELSEDELKRVSGGAKMNQKI